MSIDRLNGKKENFLWKKNDKTKRLADVQLFRIKVNGVK